MKESESKQHDDQYQTHHEHSLHGSMEHKPVSSLSEHQGHAGGDKLSVENSGHQHAAHAHAGHDDSGNKPEADNSNHENHPGHKHSSHGGSDNQHAGHGGEGHASHAQVFKRRFFISLLIGVPILFLAPMMGVSLPFQFSFPGSRWAVMILATILYFYGGAPFPWALQ
jgi:Cu2+-exporting ATPase